jgi:Fe2+ transport system protein FeoA
VTTLDRVAPGRRVRVTGIGGAPDFVQRLGEFGLLEGEEIEVLAVAPLGDPVEIRCGGGRLCLRKTEAAGVRVDTAGINPAAR